MKCEIRKSCTLRNAVYEIGKMSGPVAVVLMGDTETSSPSSLSKTLCDRFWSEMVTVFRDVGKAYVYTIEEDVAAHLHGPFAEKPIVIELSEDFETDAERFGVLKRLQETKIKSIALVALVHGMKEAVRADRIMASLALRMDSTESGVDAIIAIDDGI